MSDIKLTKSELAALDLLIENMQSERLTSTGAVDARWTKVIARVTRALLKATPIVTELAGGGSLTQEVASERLQESAQDITPGISLEALVELRRKATGQD